MGLVHWASPITSDGMMKGAIFGGPVHMIEPEDFLIEELIVRTMLMKSSLQKLASYL